MSSKLENMIGRDLSQSNTNNTSSQPSRVEQMISNDLNQGGSGVTSTTSNKIEKVVGDDLLKLPIQKKGIKINGNPQYTQEEYVEICKKSTEIACKSDEGVFYPIYKSQNNHSVVATFEESVVKTLVKQGKLESCDKGYCFTQKVYKPIKGVPYSSIATADVKALVKNGDIQKNSEGKYELANTPTGNFYKTYNAEKDNTVEVYNAKDEFIYIITKAESKDLVDSGLVEVVSDTKLRWKPEGENNFESVVKTTKVIDESGKEVGELDPDNYGWFKTMYDAGIYKYDADSNAYVINLDVAQQFTDESQRYQSPETSASPNVDAQYINNNLGNDNPEVNKYIHPNQQASQTRQTMQQQKGFSVGTDRDMYASGVNYAKQTKGKGTPKYYVKQTVVRLNGEKVPIKIIKDTDFINLWEEENDHTYEDYCKYGSSKEEGLVYIQRAYMHGIEKNFRPIKSLIFTGTKTIVNGVEYKLDIPKNYAESHLPLSWGAEIMSGNTYVLFKPDMMYKKDVATITEITFDDAKKATEFAQALVSGGRGGVNTFFRIFQSLETLTIGEEVLTREDLNTPKSSKIKEYLSRENRSSSLFDGWRLGSIKRSGVDTSSTTGWKGIDGWKPDFYGATDGMQTWSVENIKRYATNRGDKGIIRWGLGLTIRTLPVVAFTAVNLGTHIFGWGAKKVKGTWETATTPVEQMG